MGLIVFQRIICCIHGFSPENHKTVVLGKLPESEKVLLSPHRSESEGRRDLDKPVLRYHPSTDPHFLAATMKIGQVTK